jgi:TonB family protein
MAPGAFAASDEPFVGVADVSPPADGVQLDERFLDPTGEPPRTTRGEEVAHLDTGTAGRGGDAHAAQPALNLADRDERVRLSPDLLNRMDRDQLQRLRVARARESWEDRRSTTHPAELTFVVTGPGAVLEPRLNSSSMPSRGAAQSRFASVRGGELGSPGPSEPDAAERQAGGGRRGARDGAPGTGFVGAAPGVDHRPAAPVGSARPYLVRAPVAVPAPERGRPKDDVASTQEVATTVRALVHASAAGGDLGMGSGGEGGGGEAGEGARAGAGASARPLGADGEMLDYWTSDPRLLGYFRQLHARIDPLWADAFPKSAIAELKQGTVILVLTIQASGQASVEWPPLRPSGVDEFDRNCAQALRRASPFPPIPAALGVHSLTIRVPFTANNPVIK